MRSPYAPENENQVQSLTDLFGQIRIAERYKKNGTHATSERAELIGYFAKKLEWEPSRVGFKLAHLKDLTDLYHIKSSADAYEREGKGPWAKAFHGMLKPR